MNTKRYFLLSVIVILSAVTAYGAYLKNVPQKLTQPDGTVINCFATGDEFHNWLHDSAGYTIIQHPQTGYYVYAIESEGELLSSSYIVGQSNPQTLNIKPNSNISPEKIAEKRNLRESMIPEKRTHKADDKNHGHINNLVFFIRFSDENSFISSYTDFVAKHNDSSLMDASNSMFNYYKLSSYGQFTVTTTFYPSSSSSAIYSYQDIHPRSYYKEQSATNPNGYVNYLDEHSRKQDLLRRTIEFLKDSVSNSLDLDFNNDGDIDNICFLTSGYPEGWSDLLWPHRSSFLYASGETPLYINGKQVSDYNFIMEMHASTGVLTHEFMHTLGAPDLYRYDYSGTPVGRWDLMASTNDNVPQGMGVYMKHKYGNWVESIPEITSPGTYTLYPANGTSTDKIAYLFRPDPYSNQCLLLEYRKTNSNIFEGSLPSSGLLIYRINGQFGGNGGYDGVSIFDEVYIYRPSDDYYFSNATFSSDYGRTEFNLFTNPFPHDYNGNPIQGVMIKNISVLGDSMQFTVGEVIEEMTVSTNNVYLSCSTNSKNSFNITSNTTWSIFGEHQWLAVGANSGRGSQTINLTTTSGNGGSEAKICTLTVRTGSYDNPLYERIVIRQLPCGAGIEDIDNIQYISVYPNPANDYVYIDYPKSNVIQNISIYSVTGQKISSGFNTKNNNIKIPISNLSTGIYYLKIDTEKQSVFRMFSVK